MKFATELRNAFGLIYVVLIMVIYLTYTETICLKTAVLIMGILQTAMVAIIIIRTLMEPCAQKPGEIKGGGFRTYDSGIKVWLNKDIDGDETSPTNNINDQFDKLLIQLNNFNKNNPKYAEEFNALQAKIVDFKNKKKLYMGELENDIESYMKKVRIKLNPKKIQLPAVDDEYADDFHEMKEDIDVNGNKIETVSEYSDTDIDTFISLFYKLVAIKNSVPEDVRKEMKLEMRGIYKDLYGESYIDNLEGARLKKRTEMKFGNLKDYISDLKKLIEYYKDKVHAPEAHLRGDILDHMDHLKAFVSTYSNEDDTDMPELDDLSDSIDEYKRDEKNGSLTDEMRVNFRKRWEDIDNDLKMKFIEFINKDNQ